MAKVLIYKAVEQPIPPPTAVALGWDTPSPPAVLRRSRAQIPFDSLCLQPPAATPPTPAWGWDLQVPAIVRRARAPLPFDSWGLQPPPAPPATPTWGWLNEFLPPSRSRAGYRADHPALAPAPPATSAWGWDASPPPAARRNRQPLPFDSWSFAPPAAPTPPPAWGWQNDFLLPLKPRGPATPVFFSLGLVPPAVVSVILQPEATFTLPARGDVVQIPSRGDVATVPGPH